MSKDCIFCKIVAGGLPCSKVYGDEHSIAFIDIGPIVKGHTLVIPKAHHDPITNTPDDILRHLICVVRIIAKALVDGLGAEGINVSQANGVSAGQVVPHMHFHVIPRFSDDGHSWNWASKSYDSPDDMESCADKIRKQLG